jgi:hypothetical protein
VDYNFFFNALNRINVKIEYVCVYSLEDTKT